MQINYFSLCLDLNVNDRTQKVVHKCVLHAGLYLVNNFFRPLIASVWAAAGIHSDSVLCQILSKVE